MKKYFISVIATLFAVCSNSYGQVTIKAVEEGTNEPIPFFTAYYIDHQFGKVADSIGQLVIDESLRLPIRIKISASGFESIVVELLGEKATKIVVLTHTHIEFDEVSVATPRESLSNQNATHVEKRSIEELNSVPTTNIGEALQQIPGVYSSSSGTGVSKPVIRGFQGVRIVSLLNGVRMENQQWGGDHDFGLTDLGIGSVEVIKGPASLLYGADALGGVLYFTDENYAKMRQLEVNASSQFESNTLGTKSNLGIKFATKHFRINVFGNYTNHADYQLPDGNFVVNSRFNGYASKMAIGVNKGNWVAHIRYAYSKSFVGIIGAHGEEDAEAHGHNEYETEVQERVIQAPFQRYDNHLVSWENKFFVKKAEWMVLLAHAYNQLSENEESLNESAMQLTLNNTSYKLRYKRKFGQELEFIAGIQGAYQTNVNSGVEEQLIPDATQLDNGLYAILYKDWSKWHLQAGARYDLRLLNAPEFSFSRNYGSPNFSIGAVRTGKINVLKINLSSGFRVPHLSELLADGEHHGALRYEIGNRDLRPEQAFQLDLADEINGDHLSIVFNPFFNFIQQYIYLHRTDSLIDELPVYEYKQLEQAYLFGGDISAHYHPHFAHWLHWEPSFSYLYGQDAKGAAIPFIPQARVRNLIRFDINTKKNEKLMNIVVQHAYYFDQKRVSGLETVSKNYNLVNIGLNYKYFGKAPIELGIGVKNLFNEEYIDHLSRLKNLEILHPGRNYYVRLKVALVKKNKN